jgi:cytochrome c oxidase subunit 3
MHGFEVSGIALGHLVLGTGLTGVLFTMFVWWRDVVREGVIGKFHTDVVRKGLRIGMALFILSEMMFFFAFFWAFFKAVLDPVLLFDGGHLFESATPLVRGVWPPEGIEVLNAWDLPLMNTLVLLLSGCTVTWAHYALLHNDRKGLIRGLTLTVLLGAAFTCLQLLEYGHATFGFKEGIYPSTFYMATGFHGVHVLIGTLFLLVCLLRAVRGQLTPEGHLGFEFAAWYWHFVDVVWLFLFVFVYVWGS